MELMIFKDLRRLFTINAEHFNLDLPLKIIKNVVKTVHLDSSA